MAIDIPAAQAELAGPRTRPDAPLLARYVVTGRLPDEYRSWILHDLTCPSWALRHFARRAVVVLPLLAIYLTVVPGSLGLRLLTGLTFVGGLFLYSFVNVLVVTDRRAVRAGYPTGLVSDIREHRSRERHRLATHERRERIAARQQARRR